MGVQIVGLGKYLPEFELTNKDFEKLVDTTDEWITTRTGIKTRRIETEKLTWQMGAEAAKKALENANITAEDIDLIVVSTCTADYLTPSMSCLVANEIGAKSPACFDINCACSGFVAAMDMVEAYLSAGRCERALIVSTEMLSKMVDYTDRTTCVLFGDGAGACVVEKSDGVFCSDLGSDPKNGYHLFSRGVMPNNPFIKEKVEDGWAETNGYGLHQDGKDVYKFATRAMPKALKTACEKAGIEPTDLDWVFPHQANSRILETAAKNLNLPIEKFYMNIQDHGNMSSACIPVCLTEAAEKNMLKKGDKICIVGFGGGLTYAAAVFTW